MPNFERKSLVIETLFFVNSRNAVSAIYPRSLRDETLFFVNSRNVVPAIYSRGHSDETLFFVIVFQKVCIHSLFSHFCKIIYF